MKIVCYSWGRIVATFLMLSVLLAVPVQAQVIINEVMASNDSAVQNDGIYPDWVELYNPTGVAIDISDWSITDSASTPRKYVFPGGTFVGPNGYLVVWLDALTNTPLHTGFTISGTTDDISIYNSTAQGGTQQDTIAFGLQITDLSIGRVPDGLPNQFTLTVPTPGAANQAVPLGVQDNLKINEIMAAPDGGDDWFELYNPGSNYVQFGGLYWSDRTNSPSTNRPIPGLSFIAPEAFIQFFADNLQNRDADQTDFRLSAGGEAVALFRTNKTSLIDSIIFGQQTNGVSIGRLPDGSGNVVFFAQGRSTPGASNFQLIMEIIINEILTHTDPPLEDAVELYNPTATNVNISGWWLSNSRDDPKKFRIPGDTIVPPGGYKVFYEWPGNTNGFNFNGQGTNRSFTFNSARGDQVYLHTADANGDLTFFRASRDFGPSANSVSFGRHVTSDGKQDLVAMTRRSFGVDNPTSQVQFRTGTGLTNPYPLVGPLVINEIMYHPPDILTPSNTMVDNDLDEYIEIHNPGATAVPLYDPIVYPFADGRTNTWRLRGGVDFNFPTNVVLQPGGFLLVVNFNPATNTAQLAAFRDKYSVPVNVQILGPYSGGNLDNGGGTIDLLKPDPPQDPMLHPEDEGLVPYVRVEKIEYDDTAPWPTEADAMGAALQRVHALGYGNDPTNWLAVAPSPGAVFIPNTPPTIDPIADVITNEMRRISFFVTAHDTNVPSQALSFSLEAGAPTGASIDPSGLFRWRPGEEHGQFPGQVYPVTVRVTDNGAPPQSATRTFNITINEVNRPPYFRIREQWVKADTQLSFLTGYDVDLPPQIVTYSIAGDAPAGLTVDSNSGVVSWMPNDSQASSTPYHVTVEAFDDGTPILTNRFTYIINVLPSTAVLVWPDIRSSGNEIVIEWQATIGKTYVVEFTDTLTPPNWAQFSDFLGAENTTMSVTDLRFNSQRFYRVIQVD